MIKPFSILVLAGLLSVFSPLYGQNMKYALKVVEDLTKPEFHGRGYVMEGDQKAASYIRDEFKRYGLQPLAEDYYQPFSFDVNTFPGAMDIAVDGKALQPGIDFIIDPSSGGIGDETRSVVTFTLEELEGGALAEQLRKPDFTTKNIAVFDLTTVTDKQMQGEIRILWQAMAGRMPAALITDEKFTWGVGREEYAYPLALIAKSEWPEEAKEVKLNIEQSFKAGHQTQNVLGWIEGTDRKKKKEFVFFSAHYDHLGHMGKDTYFPGANDNASGVAMFLSLVRYYTENPPEYSVVFVAFAGEEAGLVGSKYYTEHPVLPLKKIRFLLNLDLLGTGEEGITVVNATLHGEEYRTLVRLNTEHDWLPKVKKRGTAANSDHYWFTEAGVPAFFIYTMGGVKHYHDVHDKAETLPLTEYDDVFHMLTDFVKTL